MKRFQSDLITLPVKTIVWNTVHETSFTLKKEILERKKERNFRKKERKKFVALSELVAIKSLVF